MADAGAEPHVLIERPLPGVALITLNRPSDRNALSMALRSELTRALDQLGSDPTLSAVVLTGAGQAFCAGLDLKELRDNPGVLTSDRAVNPILAIRDFPGAVIGAINGPAITGGFELALACDMLVAGQAAKFADTHLKVGALPGWQLSQRLSRSVGPYRARHMAFSSEMIDAATAERWGIVSEVTADANLLERVMTLAEGIASADRTSLLAYKSLINEGYNLSLKDALALELERSSNHHRSADASAVHMRSSQMLKK